MQDEDTLHQKAVSPWKALKPDERYYAYLQEHDSHKTPRIQPRPRDLLRRQPVIIPLEPTESLPDPRLEPPIKFLTLPNVTIGPETAENEGNEDPEPPAEPFEVSDNTVQQLQELVDNLANELSSSPPPENTDHTDHPEDIVYLDINDWLIIDSQGSTPNPEDLLPPAIEQIDYLDSI